MVGMCLGKPCSELPRGNDQHDTLPSGTGNLTPDDTKQGRPDVGTCAGIGWPSLARLSRRGQGTLLRILYAVVHEARVDTELSSRPPTTPVQDAQLHLILSRASRFRASFQRHSISSCISNRTSHCQRSFLKQSPIARNCSLSVPVPVSWQRYITTRCPHEASLSSEPLPPPCRTLTS